MARTDPKLPRLLSIDQVSDLLGVSTKTVQRLIRNGELPRHKIGSRVAISEHTIALSWRCDVTFEVAVSPCESSIFSEQLTAPGLDRPAFAMAAMSGAPSLSSPALRSFLTCPTRERRLPKLGGPAGLIAPRLTCPQPSQRPQWVEGGHLRLVGRSGWKDHALPVGRLKSFPPAAWS